MAAKNRLKVAHQQQYFYFHNAAVAGDSWQGGGGLADCSQQDGDCAATVTKLIEICAYICMCVHTYVCLSLCVHLAAI